MINTSLFVAIAFMEPLLEKTLNRPNLFVVHHVWVLLNNLYGTGSIIQIKRLTPNEELDKKISILSV